MLTDFQFFSPTYSAVIIKSSVNFRYTLNKLIHYLQPGIQRVQALTDISHSAPCCHSNETRAPIANPPNSAQLEGTPYHSPTYIRVCAVVWECGEGQSHRQTDTLTDTQTALTTIGLHFAWATSLRLTWNVTKYYKISSLIVRDVHCRPILKHCQIVDVLTLYWPRTLHARSQ